MSSLYLVIIVLAIVAFTAHAHPVYSDSLLRSDPVYAAQVERLRQVSMTPLRGWNSYDAFDFIINQTVFFAQADYMADHLVQFGYNIVTIDWFWYMTSNNVVLVDEFGRPTPDPTRWPSAADGSGLKKVADYVHSKGLLFGIHTMRGVSYAAINARSRVYGTNETAADIFVRNTGCNWLGGPFYTVNLTTAAGQLFYDSIYKQYADWGVDLIKNDCIYDMSTLDQIFAVSAAIEHSGRPMFLSLSPGNQDAALPGKVAAISNQYRVADDTWDNWGNLQAHFRDAVISQPYIGVLGRYGGRSFPDLDMLPLGWIGQIMTPTGPDHFSWLTKDEQQTMLSLWCICRSPLIYGGDFRYPEPYSLGLITNRQALTLNAYSTNNSYINGTSNTPIWWADSTIDPVGYVAVFNTADAAKHVTFDIAEVTWRGDLCDVYSIWSNQDIGTFSTVIVVLNQHASALFALHRCRSSKGQSKDGVIHSHQTAFTIASEQ